MGIFPSRMPYKVIYPNRPLERCCRGEHFFFPNSVIETTTATISEGRTPRRLEVMGDPFSDNENGR